jgi:hypothetical protein
LKWKLQADQKSVDLSKEFFYKLASAKLKEKPEKPKEEAKQSKPEIQAKPAQSENNFYQQMNMHTLQPPVNLNYFLQSQPTPSAHLMPNLSPFPGAMHVPFHMNQPNFIHSYQMNQPPIINMMNNSAQATPNLYFGSNNNNNNSKNKNFKNAQNTSSDIQTSCKKFTLVNKNFGSTGNLNKTKTVGFLIQIIEIYKFLTLFFF